ncbi:MAG: hypothetical protein JSR19_03225 [Proteobacteria bacterium]|nr:hypothetical protein [Pseudomonadota bacterium]HQR04860.1 hypothetical protein [Rhodocyclaceae bacterium]
MRKLLAIVTTLALAGGAHAGEDCSQWKSRTADAFAGTAAPRGVTVTVKVKDGKAEISAPRTSYSDVWLRVQDEACGIDVSFPKRCRVDFGNKWEASCQAPELGAEIAALASDNWALATSGTLLTATRK